MLKIFLFLPFLWFTACSKQSDKAVSDLNDGKLVFEDRFERDAIGEDWLDTGGRYRIVDGEIRAQGSKNKPLWLKRKLPRNARVTFTARSESPAVDIKAEIYGDGQSFAQTASYTATSYVTILGGWNNTLSIIARMNEHGKDRVTREFPKAVQGKTYRFDIVRRESRLMWYLNSELFLEFDDTKPLIGASHEYFAFNNWKSEVYYDDFRIFSL